MQHRTNFQRNAFVLLNDDAKRRKFFGFGLEKLSDTHKIDDGVPEKFVLESIDTLTVQMPHEVVAILTLLPTSHSDIVSIDAAADWRSGDWRGKNVIVGPMAKDACASEPRPCAVVLVLLDPLVRLASDGESSNNRTNVETFKKRLHRHAKSWSLRGFTLLDALLPLNTNDLERLDDPRAVRINRYGPGNAAEVADSISRLETDAFLVLLAADPESSKTILNMALKTRPDARQAAEIAVEIAAQHDARGRQALKGLSSDSRDYIRRLLTHDIRIYDAAKRLFYAQCDAVREIVV
jgi:hypothetical protein